MSINNEHPETPTGDAADRFLGKQGPPPKKEFSSREKEAIRLAKREDDLADRINAALDHYHPDERYDIEIEPDITVNGPDRAPEGKIALSVGCHDHIYFTQFRELQDTNEPTRLHYVNSRNRLIVMKHTDKKTAQEVEDMDWSLASTAYFFDSSGNSGKIIYLPKDLDDDRPDTIPEDDGWKTVVEEITDSDIILVDKALDVIEERFQQA